MDLKEMFSKIRSGEVAAHSELGTRDEFKQSRNFTARIRKLKIATNINGHVLVMKDVVIPFNPFTCEPDDVYTERTPFRPILLVSQTLAGIKSYCAENPDAAEKWAKILKKDDIDWTVPPTREDYLAFKAAGLIKPRIMSYSTVALNFGGLCGFPEFRRSYTIDPTLLDKDNNYLPGVNPLWHQGAVFFNMMLKPEIDEVTAQLERQGASKETIANQRRTIRSKSPVSFVMQTNLVPYLYFPRDTEPKKFDLKRPEDFEPCIRWSTYDRSKWSSAISEAMEDNGFDESMDFFGLHMRTPRSNETKSDMQVYTDDDTLELYKAMTITNINSRMSLFTGRSTINGKEVDNASLFAEVWEAAAAYFQHSQEESMKPEGETFEKLMAASNGFRPIDSVMDKFLPACNQVFLKQFADTKYYTPDIKKGNSAFFVAMNAENAMALAEFDEDELDDAAKSQQDSLKSIMNQARDDESLLGDGVEELSLAGDDE